MKLYYAALAGLTAIALAACNGTSASSPFFPSNSSYVRIANGSPDAGSVDVRMDGSTVSSGVGYGTMTSYQSAKVGSHTLSIYRAGNDGGKPLATTTFSTNAGQDTTVVLTGERRPRYRAKGDLGLRVFAEQPYDTPTGGAAVNFHNAAPIAGASLHLARVHFGYSPNAAPGNNSLGSAQSYGGATGPQGLPSSALNTAITFYAKNYKAYTITPGDAMSGCTGMPCNGQANLSLYLIDGPGASRAPSSGHPSYFPAKSKADFIGSFDANGLVQ